MDDLLIRYPTTLVGEDTQKGREWKFTQDDIYAVTEFHFELGESFRIGTGVADLGIGHTSDGAVWAVVIPREMGTLKSEVTAATEPVSHIWLRFHPKAISELFPPEKVSRPGGVEQFHRMRQIANWKFPSSWHAGALALIPSPGIFTVDVDTRENKRRFFHVDRVEKAVKYYPNFSKTVPDIPITKAEAEVCFDQLWTAYDAEYAMFAIRPEMDWNVLRDRYRPRALQSRTAYEFASICAEMLAHLRDLHIWIRLGEESIPVYNRPRPGNANPKAVSALLGGVKQAGNQVEWAVTDDKIGYLAVYGLNDSEIPTRVDTVLESMTATRGLIFDVRMNGGGSEHLGLEMAGRFLDREAVYSFSLYRNGPKHSDLTEKIPRRVAPRGEWRYDRPVILLIGQRCLSSCESFIAMMDQCPQVTMMGDRTGGSSGNPKLVELPIGMKVSLPRWIDLLADEKPLDERGIVPDVLIQPEDGSFQGNDPVLRAALERLRQEPLPEKPIPTPEKISSASESAEESPVSSAPVKKSQKTPHVVMLDPLFGATDVPSQSEILVTFDMPMNPDRVLLHWNTGGFRRVGDIEFYKDIFQFVIPVEMEPGIAHKVSLPANGFMEEEGGGSTAMEWSFQTAPWEMDEQTPSPHLEKIDPATGSMIPRVTQLRLQYDVPLAPLSISVRDVGQTSKPGVAWCPKTEYEEESHTLIVPILLPPNWEGEIQVSGIQSAGGKRADPIRLAYKTGETLYEESQKQTFLETRQSDKFRALISAMKESRKGLHSFEEIVLRRTSSLLLGSGFTYLKLQSARFRIQGTTLFVADLRNMAENPLLIGSTGRRFWRYEENAKQASLKGLPPEEVQTLDIHIADPFYLSTADIDTVLAENDLEYLGTKETIDKTVHVLRAWRVIPGKEREELHIDEWWIDTGNHLPVLMQRTGSEGINIVYRFLLDKINEEFSPEDFAPASVTQVPLQLEEPLGEGFESRFIRVDDGSNGDFQAEWGKTGPETTERVGVN